MDRRPHPSSPPFNRHANPASPDFVSGTIKETALVGVLGRNTGYEFVWAHIALDTPYKGRRSAKLALPFWDNTDIVENRVRARPLTTREEKAQILSSGISTYRGPYSFMQRTGLCLDFRTVHLTADDSTLIARDNPVEANLCVLGVYFGAVSGAYYRQNGFIPRLTARMERRLTDGPPGFRQILSSLVRRLH